MAAELDGLLIEARAALQSGDAGAARRIQTVTRLRWAMYELTTQLATLEPPPQEVQQLLAAIHGNQPAMDAFASVVAGTLAPVELFDPDRVDRLLDPPAA